MWHETEDAMSRRIKWGKIPVHTRHLSHGDTLTKIDAKYATVFSKYATAFWQRLRSYSSFLEWFKFVAAGLNSNSARINAAVSRRRVKWILCSRCYNLHKYLNARCVSCVIAKKRLELALLQFSTSPSKDNLILQRYILKSLETCSLRLSPQYYRIREVSSYF